MSNQQHLLERPSLLDPFWFNKMKRGSQEAVVVDEQTIDVHGVLLHLAHPEEVQLVPSEKAFVTLAGNFYLETESERGARQEEADEQHAHEQETKRIRLNTLRAEAEAFNARICVPIAWCPGYKAVLSGLSKSSWGDGRNRATVEHIWLQADLHVGRLHREKGDFLCSSSGSDNGKQWVSPGSTALDGNGNAYAPNVTCQVCLKIAQRWAKRLSQ